MEAIFFQQCEAMRKAAWTSFWLLATIIVSCCFRNRGGKRGESFSAMPDCYFSHLSKDTKSQRLISEKYIKIDKPTYGREKCYFNFDAMHKLERKKKVISIIPILAFGLPKLYSTSYLPTIVSYPLHTWCFFPTRPLIAESFPFFINAWKCNWEIIEKFSLGREKLRQNLLWSIKGRENFVCAAIFTIFYALNW